MKHHKTEAIVLRRINYGEADRIATVLSPSLGVVSVMVRGARKLKSKLAAGSEPFAINQMVLIEGKGDIYTLSSAGVERSFRSITTTLERSDAAFMMLKRILKIKFTDDTASLYEVTGQGLEAFDNQAVPPELTSLWVYLRLLQLLGHTPDLSVDAEGKALMENQTYHLDEDKGALVVGGFLTADHIKLWRLAGKYTPDQLAQIKGAKTAAGQSLEAAEAALDYQLSR